MHSGRYVVTIKRTACYLLSLTVALMLHGMHIVRRLPHTTSTPIIEKDGQMYICLWCLLSQRLHSGDPSIDRWAGYNDTPIVTTYSVRYDVISVQQIVLNVESQDTPGAAAVDVPSPACHYVKVESACFWLPRVNQGSQRYVECMRRMWTWKGRGRGSQVFRRD